MRRGIRNKEQGPTNLKMRNKELQRFIDAKQGTSSKEFKDGKQGTPRVYRLVTRNSKGFIN